jgi:hypothetical protein
LVAAPVFRQIAERTASYLNIRPDIEDKSPKADAVAQAIDNRLVKTGGAAP